MSMSIPTVTETYGHAWQELKRCFLSLLGVTVAWSLVLGIGGRLPRGPVNLAWHSLVVGPVGIGALWAYLRVARGETPSLDDLLVAVRRNYLQAVLLSVLMGLVVGAGILLFVIPGVWAGLRLSWAPFLMLDDHLGAVDAMSSSWNLTYGHGLRLFGIWSIAALLAILGAMLFLIGTIPASMWSQVAVASYYVAIRGR
ncbi:MAG: hypothetical protein WCH13_01855 [Deltaproteobacteria bacterium]|jgi:hypothetical protein